MTSRLPPILCRVPSLTYPMPLCLPNSYMGVIEGLLQRRGGTEGISSLQQLEDIMLMEVRTDMDRTG